MLVVLSTQNALANLSARYPIVCKFLAWKYVYEYNYVEKSLTLYQMNNFYAKFYGLNVVRYVKY